MRAKRRGVGRLAAVAAAVACCAAGGGTPDEAEQAARSALEAASEAHGASSLEAARAMDSLVDSLIRGGRAGDPSTKDLALRAVRIKERRAPSAEEISTSAGNLLRLYEARGEYREVPELYERGRKVWLADPGAVVADFCEVLAKSERADLALEACDACIRAKEREAVPGPLARAYGRRASVHAKSFDYGPARADLRRACELLEAPEAWRDRARCLHDLARLQSSFGDLGAARTDQEAAIQILEEEAPNDPLLAEVQYASGRLLEELGDIGGARARFARAVAIQSKVDDDGLDLSTYLLGLARRKSRNDELGAEALARRALAIREKELGPALPGTLEALEVVAEIEDRAGSDWEARALQERAAWTREVLHQPEPLAARSLLRLARMDLVEGRLAQALDRQGRAVVSLVEQLGEWSPDLASARAEMAGTLVRMDHVREASRIARDAEGVYRESLRRIARTLPRDVALRFAAARPASLDVLLTLAARRGGDAARTAWEELTRSRSIVRDESAPLEAGEYLAACERLARILVRDASSVDPPSYKRALEQARAREEELGRAPSLRDRSAVRPDAILSALPRRAALVSYARYESVDAGDARYLAFVAIGGSSEIAVVPLGPAATIDRRVDASLVWDPIVPSLAATKRLFVIPDGALGRIDFAALVSDEGRSARTLQAERDLLLER